MKALRVLIVEDQMLISLGVEGMLEDLGHKVCAMATNQDDALAAAKLHQPDLIISDIRLGRGDGLAAAEQIRRTRPVPFIFMSGDHGTVEKLEGKAVVVRKPFRPEDLAQAIEKAIAA